MNIPIIDSMDTAIKLDSTDPLSHYRQKFLIPQHLGRDVHYFTGNSLGLQPRSTRDYIIEELDDWAKYGVEGHFEARRNWFGYHHYLTPFIANIVGAKPIEVVAMNTLSVNLNLLMISFYRPSGTRTKILMEASAFPSDHYAVQQQIKLHKLNPDTEIILLEPRPGEYTIHTSDIISTIEQLGDTLALVMLGGVNYYTGQLFELNQITQAAHRVGAIAGYDLAHAAGNVPLSLHDWDVDFATWCSYKYLNSGPGGVSGVFVHERHAYSYDLPRLAGWWGNDEKTRFEMSREYIPQPGAAGWQMSNAQILPMAAHLASLKIFDEVGMKALREKSLRLTGSLEQALDQIKQLTIITPRDPDHRGCQLSIIAQGDAKGLFKHLKDNGIICDWREPDVIRVAPVPLYNNYQDIFALTDQIKKFYNA